MRIAYLFARYPVLSQTYIDTEIMALERMGLEIEIYSLYPPPSSFRHEHHARIKSPIFYSPPQAILKLWEKMARLQTRWPEALVADHAARFGNEHKPELRARNALFIAHMLLERGIRHCHVHFANTATHTAIFVKHLTGICFSMSTHGQDFMDHIGTTSQALLCEYSKEALFVANETEWSRQILSEVCANSKHKMIRAFNGIDLANFPIRPPNTLHHDRVAILSVGRLIEFKGFHHLINAAAVLRDKGLEFQCDIVGEGPYREKLQSLIEELNLQKQVHLLGVQAQEDIFRLLHSCDIFALACVVDSHGASDVFPTVILEAMAAGKPVVSSRLAGVPEQVIHGETGFLGEPKDEAALANALEKLIVSPQLRIEMGQAGRKRLEKEFAVEKTALTIKETLDDLASPSVPKPRKERGLAVICQTWPGASNVEEELLDLSRDNINLPIYVALPTDISASRKWPEMLHHLFFLPDAMVLEGEWRQERALVHRLELLRSTFRSELSTEWFLSQARYALTLRGQIERDCVRHVHAISCQELLWGWFLQKLTGVTLSVTLRSSDYSIPPSVVSKLLESCVGIKIVGSSSHLQSLLPQTLNGPLLMHCNPAFSAKKEWQQKLSTWAGTH